MFVTFQYRGLHHLDVYCTLTIEALMKSRIHLYCRCLELLNAFTISLVFIKLKERDGTDSKYPSIGVCKDRIFVCMVLYAPFTLI